jgi:hypothetical protein
LVEGATNTKEVAATEVAKDEEEDEQEVDETVRSSKTMGRKRLQLSFIFWIIQKKSLEKGNLPNRNKTGAGLTTKSTPYVDFELVDSR